MNKNEKKQNGIEQREKKNWEDPSCEEMSITSLTAATPPTNTTTEHAGTPISTGS